jgi:hypothetical protein
MGDLMNEHWPKSLARVKKHCDALSLAFSKLQVLQEGHVAKIGSGLHLFCNHSGLNLI